MDPQWADDPGVKEYFAFMKQYMPTADLSNSNYAAGYHYATLLMTVLRACKDDVSRDNIMRQAASLKDVKLPLLLPGMTVTTAPGRLSAVPAASAAALQRQELGEFWRRAGRSLGPTDKDAT